MSTFRVTWEIDIEALTPRKAAIKALQLQRDPFSTCTVFEVFDELGGNETIDLEETEIEGDV